MNETEKALVLQEFWAILNISTLELATKMGISLVAADVVMDLISAKFDKLKKGDTYER